MCIVRAEVTGDAPWVCPVGGESQEKESCYFHWKSEMGMYVVLFSLMCCCRRGGVVMLDALTESRRQREIMERSGQALALHTGNGGGKLSLLRVCRHPIVSGTSSYGPLDFWARLCYNSQLAAAVLFAAIFTPFCSGKSVRCESRIGILMGIISYSRHVEKGCYGQEG